MAINEQELRDQNNRLVDHCQTMRNQLEEIRKLLDECEQHYNHAIKPDMESANHDALPKDCRGLLRRLTLKPGFHKSGLVSGSDRVKKSLW